VSISPEANIKLHGWFSTYEVLKHQQRIWDFRDLFLALEEQLGLQEAGDLIMSSKDPRANAVDTIITDWSELDQDESTYFGALDLFSSLAFACMKTKGADKDVKKCLQVADNFATHLLQLDAQNLKTRPCLMWMMAGVLFEEYQMDNDEGANISFQGTFRGEYRTSTRIFPYDELPIYAPYEDEHPEWKPKAPGISNEARQTTVVVLKAAEEIGDVPVQTGCLQQLLDQGPDDPSREIRQLNELWLSTGNMAVYLRFQLFRFMLIKSEKEKEALRRDILDYGECLSVGFTEYCRCMVLRALTPKAWEKELYLSRAYETKPVNAADESDDDGGDTKDGKDGRDGKLDKEALAVVERLKYRASKRQAKKEEEDKKRIEEEVKIKKLKAEMEESVRRRVEGFARREAEMGAALGRVKKDLEGLKRERSSRAQIEWGTEVKKDEKTRISKGTQDLDNSGDGLHQERPSAENPADGEETAGTKGETVAAEAEKNEPAIGGGPRVEHVD
jgi:hypothetical protein